MSKAVRRIGVKIALAAASGYSCCYVFVNATDSLPTRLLMGLLFAGGVLFPYLRWDKFLLFRAIGLIVISTISFEFAMSYGLPVGRGENIGWAAEGYLAASVIGAAIAMTGARFLIPLKNPIGLVVTGLVAAVTGGFGFVLAEYMDNLYFAFVLWHSLMALAIIGAEYWPLSLARNK